ncbi:MAG: phosphatidate cytidylyltransferase [Bacillota bacterium]
MYKRVIWGLLGAILLLAIIMAGGLWFTLAIGALVTLGVLEYCQLLKRQNLRPQTAIMLFMSLFILVLIYITAYNSGAAQRGSLQICEQFLILTVITVFLITFISELFRGDPEQGLANAAVNLFGTVYIGIMFAYILMLRFIPGKDGLFYVLFTFLVTWSNDTAAYFVGVNFGKHKLSPRISPNKSVEGSIGGFLGGILVAVLLGIYFQKPFSLMLILGILVVVAGQIGDLIESIIKRNAGVKDSGSFLPGHGGLLDRFDSLLLSAPVVYYMIIYISPVYKWW